MSHFPVPSDLLAVPMESPDALFAPDARIQTPVPAPLLLFQCIRFPLRSHYESDEHGLLVRREDRFQENTIAFPDGSRFTATVSGSERYGLPLAHDVAGFLGILRIADEEGYGEGGLLRDATYSKIIAARNPGASGTTNQTEAAKRMLQRFGNTTVTAAFSRVLGAAGAEAEEETTRWILEYDRRALRHGSDVHDSIKELRVNPFWLAQTGERRLTSWIDVDLYDRQTQATSKMAYLRLAIAATQGHLDALRSLSLERWEEILGASGGAKKVQRAAQLESGLRALAEEGVLERVAVEKTGRARATAYTFHIEPGERLGRLRHLGQIGASDQRRQRALLWHLQHLGMAESEARSLLGQYGGRVQEVLQRVHWMRTVKEGMDGRRQPIAHWRNWIVKALVQGWNFEEPGYREWLIRQQSRFAPPAARAAPPVPVSAPAGGAKTPALPAEAPAPPDNLWGQAIEAARAESGLHPAALGLLCSCWLDEVTDAEIRVSAPDPGAAEVVERIHARRLEPLLSRIAGRDLKLVIAAGRTGGPPGL